MNTQQGIDDMRLTHAVCDKIVRDVLKDKIGSKIQALDVKITKEVRAQMEKKYGLNTLRFKECLAVAFSEPQIEAMGNYIRSCSVKMREDYELKAKDVWINVERGKSVRYGLDFYVGILGLKLISPNSTGVVTFDVNAKIKGLIEEYDALRKPAKNLVHEVWDILDSVNTVAQLRKSTTALDKYLPEKAKSKAGELVPVEKIKKFEELMTA